MKNYDYKKVVEDLISKPSELKKKKPFFRGEYNYSNNFGKEVYLSENIDANIPSLKRKIVTQEEFALELDPNSHNVLFDENIPSICVKLNNERYQEIRFQRMAIPFQKIIKDKQVLHLTGNPMQFTMNETNPTKKQHDNFIVFKQYWEERNQDGMKNKMVDVQKSFGDAGLLYYFDYKGRIKSRILSFEDGYVLCPHNDKNGDRILESVYYTKDNVEYIDSYDDKYMYRWVNSGNTDEIGENGWVLMPPVEHGFEEIPLITKRGDVAWNCVQTIIEDYEILYNIFNAIQRRYGWGILYVKGKFGDKGKKLAGNIVLNDTSTETNGDAKFLTPPSPEGTLNTLELLEETIQKGSATTFILPKDIKMSGDISGIAIMMAQSLDIVNAMQGVIEWQNVADKMVRLFKYGLSCELVNNKINKNAITEFDNIHISAKFKVWRPMNEYEYNQMITILTGAGILSKESGIELNTLSKPDEKSRINNENENNNIKVEEELKDDKQ